MSTTTCALCGRSLVAAEVGQVDDETAYVCRLGTGCRQGTRRKPAGAVEVTPEGAMRTHPFQRDADEW